MKFCPECGERLNAEYKHCPECGHSVQANGKAHSRRTMQRRNTLVGVLVTISLLVSGAVGWTLLKPDNPKGDLFEQASDELPFLGRWQRANYSTADETSRWEITSDGMLINGRGDAVPWSLGEQNRLILHWPMKEQVFEWWIEDKELHVTDAWGGAERTYVRLDDTAESEADEAEMLLGEWHAIDGSEMVFEFDGDSFRAWEGADSVSPDAMGDYRVEDGIVTIQPMMGEVTRMPFSFTTEGNLILGGTEFEPVVY